MPIWQEKEKSREVRDKQRMVHFLIILKSKLVKNSARTSVSSAHVDWSSFGASKSSLNIILWIEAISINSNHMDQSAAENVTSDTYVDSSKH